MSQKFEKLKTLLRELFQLDHPDLDFGLYRIMHAKAAEVTQFLERDLLPQVKQEFGQYKTADRTEIEQQLAKAIEQAAALGADPESLPKVKELRAKLTDDAVDLNALESEVYDYLYSFFRRYYSEGDFLSKRVYKPGVYAIPYEGEEVKLHWANADQYYIKTSEYLRDYAFRLHPDDDANPMRVHFRLVDAAEGEHGNVKAAEGKDRIFILALTDFIAEEEGEQGKELVIRFEFRPATLTDWPDDVRDSKKKPPTQKDMGALAEARIAAVDDKALAKWIAELGKTHEKADGEQAEYSRLHAHLNRYVARNTFDYFIHKDLGTFLRRELDFYVKNEVMHLDDIENESAPRVDQYLSKIKVIRRIASKIIEFLAQLEDFQKKLWLKRKFVVETNYCIAIGSIPEEFYPEIAANDAQRQEWVELFAINTIGKDLTSPGYSEPLTETFLKAHPTLIVDTRHFSSKFIELLLNSLQQLDRSTDGLVIHSDNFHALCLLSHHYSDQIGCIYIDPPYNTGDDDFPYKDGYQHSSWMSMMYDRASLAKVLLSQTGVFAVQIGDQESGSLRQLCDTVFADRKNSAVVRRGVKNVQAQFDDIDRLTLGHDIVHCYTKQRGVRLKHLYQALDDPQPGKWDTFWRGTDRHTMRYELFGITPQEGQWRWEAGRAKRAIESYNYFLKHEAASKSLDEWYAENIQCGREVNFVRQNEEGVVQYYVPPQNFRLVSDNWLDIPATGNLTDFPHEKSLALIQRIISWTTSTGGVVLDYFGGSGTTAHAALSLPDLAGGARQFITIEQGAYFDTVLLPRIKKSLENIRAERSRVSEAQNDPFVRQVVGLVKYIRLESYEDALNNLQLRRSKAQQSLLDAAQNTVTSRLKEQYILGYMLNVETEGSQSLLNVQGFTDPTAYKLKVKRPGSDESREVNVDLLETFNWLIGLTVQHIAAPQFFEAKFERDSEMRLQLKGRLKQVNSREHWFRTVTGITPDGRKTLVIWRKRPGGETPEGVEQDNLVLDEWFTRQGYSSKDSEFDLIYVNGTNNLENLRAPDDTWKVRLIEDDFHRLMFASEAI